MKTPFLFCLGASLAGLVLAGASVPATAAETPKKMLLVTVTTGFRHSSIPTAEKVLGKLAKETGAFTLDLVQQPINEPNPPRKPKDATPEQEAEFKEKQAQYKTAKAQWDAAVKEVLTKLSPDSLKNYDGVIFANTTGDLPLPDPDAFLKWLSTGKAFIGMHSATDTFHGFRPYIEMIGGEFKAHGAQATVECKNEDSKAPCCQHLDPNWTVHDEIYLMQNFDPAKVHRLLGLDKEPNSKAPGYYPIAWSKEYGQGKVFYTSLGHREDMWDDETDPGFKRINSKEVSKAYQQHILGGIKWALGLESGSATDAADFRPLFNGQDLSGWKLRNPNGTPSWSVKDGILVNTVENGVHGTDLVTQDKFWNFTVRFEYKVPAGANSGFYLRGRHEVQVLDDYSGGKASDHGNASIYGFKAPDQFTSKPVGEWNTVEATMIGNKITLIHNGVKVHDNVECNRATGSEIDNKVNEPGPIFLQGDHGSVCFRNLRIKELK